MTIFLVSLAGIPPFAGFFGKYYLFVAAIKSGYLWLTFVAIAGSLVSVYFYLGVIRMMYFVEENQSSADSSESENETGFAGISLLATTVGTIVLGLIPSVIVELVKKAL
jgi:NADH-quinone oxidoreductase subunit N